jgi:hypothetical protein
MPKIIRRRRRAGFRRKRLLSRRIPRFSGT